ncbi:MAG: AAA family ATPase [Actinomycetota bacterium]
MPALVLLNGPPAVGKSTVARRLIDRRPLALALDLDVVRGQLGRWLDDPVGAGLAARELALVMARTHLSSGRDVVVPQFLGRLDFVEQLEATAHDVRADFAEVALLLDRAGTVAAFAARSRDPEDQTHLDALALVERSELDDPIGEAWDALQRVLVARPATVHIDVVRGDPDATADAVRAALGWRDPPTTDG